MEKIPSQVTIRGVLAATFWICLTCAIWASFIRDDWNPPVPIRIGMVVLSLAGPCIAVGALFGRARLAAGIGIGITILGLLLLTLIFS